MIITTTVKASLDHTPPMETVSVMQDDKYSRNISFQLYTNGTPWTPPSDATALVRYIKPDGTGGSYDTMPDGSTACSFTDNVLTVALAPQVCTAPGVVRLTAAIISGTAELHTFTVQIHVHANPGLQVTSQDYYKVRGSLPDSGWTPNKFLGTDADGNVVELDAPEESGLPMPATAQVGQFFRVKEVDDIGKVTALETVVINLSDPVAYIYGDQQTPPAPEWDTDKYPHTVVTMVELMGKPYQIGFIVLSELTVSQGDSGMDIFSYTQDSMMSSYIYLSGSNKSTEWSELSAPVSDGNLVLDNVRWTNTDIYGSDGSLYLAASDPVPVYDGTAGGSGGTNGLEVIELSTQLKFAYNEGESTSLTTEESTALSAVAEKNMPCIIHFRIVEGDISVDAIGFAVYNNTDLGDGNIEQYYVNLGGTDVSFQRTDGLWHGRVN